MDKKQFSYINEHKFTARNNDEVVVSIRRLLMQQDFAILCTQGEFGPYSSLVAFVASEDLKTVVFATLDYTRKYQYIQHRKASPH